MENNINFTTNELDRIENMIFYYHKHTVEKIQNRHPGFVIEDFEQLLKILAEKLEIDL